MLVALRQILRRPGERYSSIKHRSIATYQARQRVPKSVPGTESSHGQETEMTIGELGRACGVRIETIRYYQRLLSTPPKGYGTIRRYWEDALKRVQFIKPEQRLGFSLAEIVILYLLDPKRDHHRAHTLAGSKLGELDQKLADMIAMRSALANLVSAC